MENCLENRKVTVKLVQKYRSGFPKNSAGNTIWDGAKRIYQAPTNAHDRLIPLLTSEEQAFFEDFMGMDKGTLSFTKKDNFWRDFKVTLEKEGRVLDLSDPEDVLSYKILLKSNNIAPNKDVINELVHDFYLVDERDEEEENIKLTDKYEEASKLFLNKVSKTSSKMINVLRLLGRNVPKDATAKWLKGELIKIIEQKVKVAGLPNIDDFISVAKDPNFDIRIFIMDAMELGEIKVDGSTYKLRAGDTIGYDLDQAISYFANPKNQQTKLLIEERIKSNK